MLIVLSHNHDASAVQFIADWPGGGAALLTAADLSVAGWRHTWADDVELPSDLGEAAAVVAGQRVLTRDITGVLTRWPRFLEQELGAITRDDRAFVAAEMTAFMTAWLSQLRCPVLNRPSPLSLCGPAWRREEWTHLACTLRIPAAPITRTVSLGSPVAPPPQRGAAVIVVAKPATIAAAPRGSRRSAQWDDGADGFSSIGEAHPRLHGYARTLAAAAGVGLLEVSFSTAESDALFLSASLWPPIHEPPVSHALHDYFQAGTLNPRSQSRSMPLGREPSDDRDLGRAGRSDR